MDIKDFTVAISSHNGLTALKLAIESLLHYHPDVQIIVHAGGSNDGTVEYVQSLYREITVLSTSKPIFHGQALDKLSQKVNTPYVIFMDNDVEVVKPVIDFCIEKIQEGYQYIHREQPSTPFAKVMVTGGLISPIGALKQSDIGIPLLGTVMQPMPRIDPYFLVIDSKLISRITNFFSWANVVDYANCEYYDVGGILLKILNLMEIKGFATPFISEAVIHYGGISSYSRMKEENHTISQELEGEYAERISLIQSRYDKLKLEQGEKS